MGFQFKKELAELVMAGTKTQTRRPVKEGDSFHKGPDIWSNQEVHRNRLLWHKGGIYAVQPGRGKPGIGHIQITNIKIEDVRNISHEDVLAEGFESRSEFLHVWCTFYDFKARGDQTDYLIWERSQSLYSVHDWLKTRPDELYQAYAISFKLWTSL
jgi:hypothetical protein